MAACQSACTNGIQICQSSSECSNPGDICMPLGGVGGGAMGAICRNPDAGFGMFPFPDGGFGGAFPDGGFGMFADGGFGTPPPDAAGD
jgi:hypothetical protein